MRSDLFSPQNAEAQTQQPGMKLQNGKMLKVALNGEMMVRQGAMVAYQGNIQFQGLGASGVGQFVKQQLTGEGVPLMRCTGSGDMFLADLASDIHLIDLEGGHDGLTINGKNVLAFEPTLSYDIRRVQGAGHALERGPVQLRVLGSGPHRDHHQGHARSCCRSTSRPTPIRRPRSAGRRHCRPDSTVPTSSASAR